MFLVVCFSWAGLGTVFAYFVLPTPLLSVGAGLGDRATHYTGHVSGVVGWVLVVPGAFRVTFLLVIPIPPRPRAGGDVDKIENTYWGTGPPRLFCVHCCFSVYLVHFLALSPLRVAWRWLSLTTYPCPFRLGLPFFLISDVSCRFHYLAVQKCRGGF